MQKGPGGGQRGEHMVPSPSGPGWGVPPREGEPAELLTGHVGRPWAAPLPQAQGPQDEAVHSSFAAGNLVPAGPWDWKFRGSLEGAPWHGHRHSLGTQRQQ